MPMPNFIAARLKDPAGFDRIVTKKNQGGDGVDFLIGFKGDSSEVTSIHFSAAKFTPTKARTWLKAHKFSPIEFSSAKKEGASVATEALTRELSFDQIRFLVEIALHKTYPVFDEYGQRSWGCRYFIQQIWMDKVLICASPTAYSKQTDDAKYALIYFSVEEDQKSIILDKTVPVQIVATPMEDGEEPVVLDESALADDDLIQEAGKRNSKSDAKKINAALRAMIDMMDESDVEEETIAVVGKWKKKIKTETEDVDDEMQEAKLTQAAVNDLPDSSFAYISPGGSKDDNGKTVPRSLRHLPYKSADGSIDKAHLRNALARLDQTDIPAAAKATARKKLIAAAKQAGIGDYDKESIDLDLSVITESGWDALEGETIGESFTFELQESSFDAKNLIIKNTTLLGPISLNKRRYSEDVQQDAVALFEGVKAYMNHPPIGSVEPRDLRDSIGTHHNVHVKEGKTYSDLHLLNNATVKDYILPILESKQTHIAGNSIVARVVLERAKDGFDDVTKIIKVRSVDMVTEPGTTTGLFESHTPAAMQEDTMDLKTLTVEQLRTERADLIEALLADHKHAEKLTGLETQVTALTQEAAEKDRKLAEYEVKETARARAQLISDLVATMKAPDAFKYDLHEGKKIIRGTLLRVLERCQTQADMETAVSEWEVICTEAQKKPPTPTTPLTHESVITTPTNTNTTSTRREQFVSIMH